MGDGGKIWAGGQPGPEMVIIQYIVNREMILSGQGVNSQTLGGVGDAGEGRYGPEASQAPTWSLFNTF